MATELQLSGDVPTRLHAVNGPWLERGLFAGTFAYDGFPAGGNELRLVFDRARPREGRENVTSNWSLWPVYL